MADSNEFFPFSAAPGNNSQAYLVYDLQINKIDPGIVYVPTEPNGVYVATREVNGCYWIVLNADYNTDAANWQQVSPQNAATAAYAVEYCSDGTITEWYSPATIIPGTAITWVQLSIRSALGNITTTPTVATAIAQNVQTLVQLWNMGTSAIANARKLNVTDTSSNSASLVDNITVNGTPVWQIRKDGTLVVGTVPFSHVVGPFVFSSLEVTGNTQLDGNLTVLGSTNLNGGAHVTGGLSTDTLSTTGDADIGGNLGVGGNETVGGTLNVTGATTLSTLHVNGNASVGGDLAVDGNETVTGNITSGGTITANAFSNSAGQLGSTSPAYITASATAPAVGSSVVLSIASTYIFEVGQTVVVADPVSAVGFSGTVIYGNGFPATQIIVQAAFYYQGAPGNTIGTSGHIYTGSGVARVTNTDSTLTITRTYNDLVINSGTVAPVVYGASFVTAANFATGNTSGSLTFPSPLPGSSAKAYTLIVASQQNLTNSSGNIVLTGSGATWPNSPQTFYNGQAASFPTLMYGTAVGGQTPSVSWVAASAIAFQPMTMTITAFVNA